MKHLRANAWLLVLSVLICSLAYPAVLWTVGRLVVPGRAEGSLIVGPDGKPLGSRLIAQPFTKDEYFQPRPSAASYNGAASAATNWGANNPLLRDRVARQLGPVVKYRSGPKAGQPVGPDIEDWVRKTNPSSTEPRPRNGREVQAAYFARWLDAHPEADLEKVPADMVMASGSGLDPHITLQNALYQLDRVAGAWAEKTRKDPRVVSNEIGDLLEAEAEEPLGGLAGVKLVNVLEVNLTLRDRYGSGQTGSNRR